MLTLRRQISSQRRGDGSVKAATSTTGPSFRKFSFSLFLRNTDMWTQSGQWSLSRKKLAWSDRAVFVVVRSRCAVAWTPKKRSMTWVWLPGFWWVGFIRREPCAVCSFCNQNVHTATSPRECFAPTVAANRTRVTYRPCLLQMSTIISRSDPEST